MRRSSPVPPPRLRRSASSTAVPSAAAGAARSPSGCKVFSSIKSREGATRIPTGSRRYAKGKHRAPNRRTVDEREDRGERGESLLHYARRSTAALPDEGNESVEFPPPRLLADR